MYLWHAGEGGSPSLPHKQEMFALAVWAYYFSILLVSFIDCFLVYVVTKPKDNILVGALKLLIWPRFFKIPTIGDLVQGLLGFVS